MITLDKKYILSWDDLENLIENLCNKCVYSSTVKHIEITIIISKEENRYTRNDRALNARTLISLLLS